MKKQENDYLFNQYEWKGIKITKNAVKQILFLINLNKENIGIQLSIKKSGCAGFRYIMELINKTKINPDNHITIFYENILIQISKKEISFLNGVQIDFINNNINKIFKFSNSKFKKFCGCGESFSIN